MNLLDKDQVKLIESDVARARLTLLNLSQELIDHICCEVENQMNNYGKSFEEAYALVKEQTGIQVLQKIQENTLYLTDKNYALMKSTMKITGNVSLALLGMGTVLKIFHWPGAGPALVLGFALLCFIFFPAAIYINQKDGGTQKRPLLNLSILLGGVLLMAGILFKVMHWPGAAPLMVFGWGLIIFLFLPVLLYVKLKEAPTGRDKRIYILGAAALMIFELSAMFKIMHWPGAGPLMLSGSFLLISFFLPMYSNAKFKQEGNKTGQFIFLITLSMYAIVLTSLLAMNVSKDVMGCFVKEESNSSKIAHYFEKKNAKLVTAFQNFSDSIHVKSEAQISDLSKEADKLHNLISGIKLELVQVVEGVDKGTAEKLIANPILIERKDNYDIVNQILIGQTGTGFAKSLKEELDAFRKNACSATLSNTELTKKIGILLDTSDKQVDNENKTWEEINFKNNMLISTLSLLTGIEKNIRMIESKAIQHIQQQNL